MIQKTPDLERAARAIEEFLDALGTPVSIDPELAGTGRRVAEAFGLDLLEGYRMDPAEILGDSTGSTSSGLIVVSAIATTTMCPHHLLPASGLLHVAYLPGKNVVGLGAIARLVECYARRLILQEDLGDSIARALVEHLGARGAGVIVDLSPSCVTARGARQAHARAVTSAFAGEMASEASLRSEMHSCIALSMRNTSSLSG